jgi:hypothetical protein
MKFIAKFILTNDLRYSILLANRFIDNVKPGEYLITWIIQFI